MSFPSGSPIVSVDENVVGLRGYASGLRLPAVAALLGVERETPRDFAAFDSVVCGAIEKFEYAPFGGELAESDQTKCTAECVVRLAIAMLRLAKVHVSRDYRLNVSSGSRTDQERFVIAIGCPHPQAVGLALRWSARTFNQYAGGPPSDADPAGFEESVLAVSAELRRHAERGVNTINFLNAADELDIPVQPVVLPIYRFGTGAHSRLLNSTMTDRTGALANTLSTDKTATAALLRKHGLPGPVHLVVDNAEAAEAAADRLGFPVVIKPRSTDLGVGVAAGLRTAAQVRDAFARAQEHGKQVLVERHFEGEEFRMTMMDGSLIKAEHRVKAYVEGDGVSTVEELVEAKSRTARFRMVKRTTDKSFMQIDAESRSLLEQAGLTPKTVLRKGKRVTLRHTSNASTGAEQSLVTADDIHPDNIALCARAAELLGLDIAGVDLIVPDISQSWRATGALICEVNVKPGIGVRTSPGIYASVLERMFANGARIPLYLLVTEERQPASGDAVNALCQELGCNGLASADGIVIDGEKLSDVPPDSFSAAQILLGEKRARCAMCIMPAEDIARHGLPADRFDAILIEGRGEKISRIVPDIRPHTTRLETLSSVA